MRYCRVGKKAFVSRAPVYGTPEHLQRKGNSLRAHHYQDFIKGRRIYVYHRFNQWYLDSLEVNGGKPLEVKTLNLASNLGSTWAGSLARIGHEPPKLGVAGSNPAPPARLFGTVLNGN